MDILIIEQDEKYLLFLKGFMAKIGQVDYCSTFAAGMSKIDEKFSGGQLYDIYLIDLALPDNSAIRLLSKIRGLEDKNEKTGSIVVLMAKDKSESILLGFFSKEKDVFIEKTEDGDKLNRIFIKLGILHNSV
ncbi:MAG: hypothetical protein LBV08_11655 [Clostridiales bacterium]|nr:hypothetical protein [Clostridiales bacterium]